MSKTEDSASDLADRLFPTESEDLHRESILSIKPEQRRLHTETYDFSVSTLLEYLKNNRLFVPEFQRRYVWSDAQASRLVESLIIQCPIPVIYLNQEQDERLSVIDGNQRLTSLQRFADNIFPLKGLTAYPELEGNFFHELDPRFQRHILNRTLRCIVILKDTHPQVKFDVFERLNTGSVKLSSQELRHGLFFGPLMDLVAKLAKSKNWTSLFPAGPDRRMRSEEFVIRFLAFHYDAENYEKPLSAFLNSFAKKNRAATTDQLDEYKSLFEEVASLVHKVYGDLAFKVFDANKKIISSFNAALFDAEVLAVSGNLEKARKFTAEKRNAWLDILAALFADENFAKTISRATSDERLVKNRIENLRKRFAEV
jgi:hypothetical protein